jgi:hypothetical protein
MMRVAIEEIRQFLREMPGAAAALLIAVILGVGAHAAIFYEADGEDFRLVANRSTGRATDEVEGVDPLSRMRSRIQCAEKIPGFTLIVGLSDYNVELTVPVTGMPSLFEDARADVARTMQPMDTRGVA